MLTPQRAATYRPPPPPPRGRLWGGILAALFITGPAQAQDFLALASSSTSYGLNTLADLSVFGASLIAAAGFYLREVGYASGGAAEVAERLVIAIGAALLIHWAAGYNLAYTEVSRFLGAPEPWAGAGLGAIDGARAEGGLFLRTAGFSILATGVAASAFGARMRTSAVLIFAAIFAAAIAPLTQAWIWGGGWLADLGARDSGGGALHVAGGAAALAGLALLRDANGPQQGQQEIEPSAAVLGGLFIWAGLAGVTGLAAADFSAVDAVARLADSFVAIHIAAAAGGVAGLAFARVTQLLRTDAGAVFGLAAGLAAIAWAPEVYTPQSALITGAVAGGLAVLAPAMLAGLRIDDGCGAAAAHLAGGLWGALAAGALSPELDLGAQLTAAAAIAVFALGASLLIWLMLLFTIGLRPSPALAPEPEPEPEE